MKTFGTFQQSLSVCINLNKLGELIENTLKELVTDYLSTVADDIDTDNIDILIEDDNLTIYDIRYTGSYTHTHYNATYTDPAEDDVTLSPDASDFDAKKLVTYINEHCPDWMKDMIAHANIDVDDDISFEESEPDWDSMPGGHDDI